MIHPAHVAHDAQVLPLAERLAQPVARFLGTGRYLAAQTLIILLWVAVNVAVVWARWDPYPFILLNLVFSTQASYAAPLILLAQNRQAVLDRARADHDHQASEENLTLTKATHELVRSLMVTKEESASEEAAQVGVQGVGAGAGAGRVGAAAAGDAGGVDAG